jgi:hypothetical protein
MSAPVAPTAGYAPARPPQAAAFASPSCPPRIPFGSVLRQIEAGTLHSAEPSKAPLSEAGKRGPRSLAQDAIAASAQRRGHGEPKLVPGASSEDRASAASSQRGPHLDEDDPLDPLNRHRATLAPPEMLRVPSSVAIHDPLVTTTAAGGTVSTVRAAASLEDLLPALVRRIAWSGDRHRGTVRLELGAGELAGATLLVRAEAGRVSLQLDLPPGVDAHRWQERICRRLASRGVATDSVEVT